MTTYAEKFIKANGQPCKLLRDPEVNTYANIRRATRAIRDYGAREANWEATMIRSLDIKSGEMMEIDGEKYIIQTVSYDHASGESGVFIVKTNAEVDIKKSTEQVDDNNNIIKKWGTLASDVPVYAGVVTAELRHRDPGLLENTRYVFHIAKSYGVEMFDRIIYNGDPYRVDAVDEVGMDGVSRLQLSLDRRA